jgi:predicted kinase
MRRRSRHTANTSESTGKIGQELPSNQPAPLVPFYPDDPVAAQPARHTVPARPHPVSSPAQAQPGSPQPAQRHVAQARPAKPHVPVKQEYNEPEGSGRLELETQPEIPSLPPPEAQAAERSPQAPKGFVVLAIGLPGSGKTTWFRRRGVTPLSSDLLRNILFDDVEEQRYQGLVFSTLRSLLRARLIARMPWNYVDATNLSIHERRQWIKMAKSFGYEVQAVFFDVPLEVCLDRNSKRDRSVSEDVMRKMAEKLKPPSFEEGFSKITVVRVKSGS